MRRRNGITLAVLIAIAIAVAVGHADAAEMRLTTENRTALAITVYGNGVALVSDERTAKVVAGLNRLAFEGVSREMIPSSAMLRTDASLRVLEMDYDFDLLTPQSLLQHAVGQTVEVVRTHPTSGQDSVEKAEVLSAENGIVLRYRDRIETGVPGRIVFEQLSNGLRALPTLVASVESIIAAERKLELSYLTGGLSWQADYTLTLNGDTANLDLTGRATLTNVSGINFPDAELGLIAGQVRRVTTDGPRPQPVAMRKAMAMAVVNPPPG